MFAALAGESPNYVLQRTPGTFLVSSKLRGTAPLNTALGCCRNFLSEPESMSH